MSQYHEQQQLARILSKVNWGDIDGMSDPNLSTYFVDRDFWHKIIDSYKYFVVGRKGTGKSALYKWIKLKSTESGDIIHNVPFGNFPFQRLLGLTDNNFARPNQYQTICKYMILSELALLIVKDANAILNDCFRDIKYHIDNVYGESVQSVFRQSIEVADQVGGSLRLNHFEASATTTETGTYNYVDFDLNRINSILLEKITNYFKLYPGQTKFIIQVDGIDENYNQITTMQDALDDYYQFIISFLKSVYFVNQVFHSECDDIAKCIVYIRSDIFYSINNYDPESARWEQQTHVLNWAIQFRTDWNKSDLKKVVNERILASLPFMNGRDGFEEIFDNNVIRLTRKISNGNYTLDNIFQYLVNRTFHRPRDIIQFCLKIQARVEQDGKLDYRAITNGERDYSLWFLGEVSNEISPKINDTGKLFDFLRLLGSNPFSISVFKSKYVKYETEVGMDAEKLLFYLYELAVINNINDSGERFSIIRNERSRFNRDLKAELHAGFWMGLYTSSYSSTSI